jgi:predicted molibdopterin-dependent oxidoreductase YjgC
MLGVLQQQLDKSEGPGSREDLTRAAEILGRSGNQGPVVIIYGSGLMRRLNASANRDLIASLAERLSAKVLPLLSRANDRGAMEIAAFFGCKGLTAPEMMVAAQKEELDLLYLIGEDIWPGNCNAEFVVVQDTFLPVEAGKFADVVFPVASFVEMDGTYTNLEARIQRLHAATGYALGSMPDWEILCRLAKRMDAKGFEYSQPSEIMAELSKTVPFYKGATYKSLEKNGAVFGRTKATRKARSVAATGTRRGPRSEKPDKEYPLSLVVELDEFVHRGTPLRSAVAGIQRLEPGEIVTLSPRDAEALGIEPDMAVNVISRRGSVVATAALSETAQPGVARMLARGGEASPIPLLDFLLDPVGKAPEEICAVRIRRV